MKALKVYFLAIFVLLLGSAFLTGCGGGSGGSAAPKASIVPTGVTATPGNGSVTVAWKAVPGATSYNIYMSTTAGVTPANGTKIASTTNSHLVTGLANSKTYYFVVTAMVSTESAASTPVVSATPAAAPPPASPTGVIATPGNTQVTIAWTPVAGATSYNIYYATTTPVIPNSAGVTKITGATNPSIVTGLTNGTPYHFVVTAVNANGESVASAPEVSATPTAATPPAAPTGVTATGGNAQVTITWPAVTGATSYNIYWNTAAGVIPNAANVIQIPGVTSPYIFPATNGTIYFFVVTAVNANGESALSNEVSALASATPGTAPFIQATILSLPGLGNPLFWLQHVDVYTDSTNPVASAITNATVIVNGNPLFYDGVRGTYNTSTTYALVANGAIQPGATVTVSVTIGSMTYTATGTEFTTFPNLNPIAFTNVNGLNTFDSNTWTWTAGAPTAGATYLFGILDSGSLDLPPHLPNVIVYPPGNAPGIAGTQDSGLVTIPISSTSGTVPANSLIPGEYEPILGMATAGVAPGVAKQIPGVGRNTGGIPFTTGSPAPGSGLWIGEITIYTSIPIINGVAP